MCVYRLCRKRKMTYIENNLIQRGIDEPDHLSDFPQLS